MKKLIGIFALIMCAGMAFAQNAKYTELLNKAKNYEAKKQYAYAMGYYYDAMEADFENCDEAKERYFVIANLIKEGKPGFGEYNAFTLYEGWVNLLKDAEKYWMEFPPVGIEFKNVKQTNMDVSKKTVDYDVGIKAYITAKTKNFLYYVIIGLNQVYENSWSAIVFEKMQEWRIDDFIKKGWDYIWANKAYWPYGRSAYENTDGTSEEILKKYGVALVDNYYNSYFSKIGLKLKFKATDKVGNFISQSELKSIYEVGDYTTFKITIPVTKLDLFEKKEYQFQPLEVYLGYGEGDMLNPKSKGIFTSGYYEYKELKVDASKFECEIEGIKERKEGPVAAIEREQKRIAEQRLEEERRIAKQAKQKEDQELKIKILKYISENTVFEWVDIIEPINLDHGSGKQLFMELYNQGFIEKKEPSAAGSIFRGLVGIGDNRRPIYVLTDKGKMELNGTSDNNNNKQEKTESKKKNKKNK